MSEDYNIGPHYGHLHIPSGLPVVGTDGLLHIPSDPIMTFADLPWTVEWHEPDPHTFWRLLSLLTGLPIPIAYVDPEDHHQIGDL